jgi:SH3 domain protein
MRHAIFWSVFVLFLPMTLCAETNYVSEIREITLRTGPGVEYRISEIVKSGTPMTVMEQAGDWTRVQLEDNKDGWVLSRFLQSTVPDSIALKKLQKTYSTLNDEAVALRDGNRALLEKSDKLSADLSQCQNELAVLNTAHEGLKIESATYLELQENHKKTVGELSVQKEKAERLEDELASVYNDNRLKWFILGAGVLLIGIIIGFIIKPQRRRSALR